MRRLNGSVGSGDGYAKIHASLAGCGVEKEEKNYIKWS